MSEKLASDSLSDSRGLFLQVKVLKCTHAHFLLCTFKFHQNINEHSFAFFRVNRLLLDIYPCFGMQKTNIIRDYLEDINEIPKSWMFWPREIWSKYADKLEVHQDGSPFLPFINILY